MTFNTVTNNKAENIFEALKWRYATKSFDSGRPASESEIRAILESIRLAPTSQGLQPFRVVVVTDSKTKNAIRKAAYDQPQVETAPHLLVFVADKDIRKNTDKIIADLKLRKVQNEKIALMRKYITLGDVIRTITFSRHSWAAQQTYIALGFAVMTAAQLRVDACPMGGFSASKIGKILGFPSNQRAVALLAVGHRSTEDSVHPKYRLSMSDLVTYR